MKKITKKVQNFYFLSKNFISHQEHYLIAKVNSNSEMNTNKILHFVSSKKCGCRRSLGCNMCASALCPCSKTFLNNLFRILWDKNNSSSSITSITSVDCMKSSKVGIVYYWTNYHLYKKFFKCTFSILFFEF